MPPRKFKKWLADLFTPEEEMEYKADGPHRSRGFFSGAQHSTLYDPIMISAEKSRHMVINVQGRTTIDIYSISQLIIPGVMHDDSARNPPPRCYPDTRGKILGRIYGWFHDRNRSELLLWITGPAGCGKSAVIQTVAEYLVDRKMLGASAFFSRRSGRNNPDRVFITIAYQLAIQIKSYRSFIIDEMNRNPRLLDKNMQEQFRIFIIEPFVQKKFGKGKKRWGILLDGLDELKGEDSQRDLIEIISTFAHEHPDAPLVWIISSRPESHIASAFEEENVRRHCLEERILINSPESRDDVERFLQSSFKMIQRKFRQSLSIDWPGEQAIEKITAAASGLFIYAELVMQFIKDSRGSDPNSRLRLLLSVINRSTQSLDPFARLDNFYGEIFSEELWPRRRQLLSFVIQWEKHSVFIPEGFNTLRGMCLFFGLDRAAIYSCLNECYSTIHVPTWEVAHRENLAFLHESFADYLIDPSRSRSFHIDTRGSESDMILRLFEIWDKCSGGHIATLSVASEWDKYCSACDDEKLSHAVTTYHNQLFSQLVHCLIRLVIVNLARSRRIHGRLHKIHMIKLCYHLDSHDFWEFALASLANYTPELVGGGLAREVKLQDLTFTHLDWEGMSPAHAHVELDDQTFKYILHRPRSSAELDSFISELRSIQERWQTIGALVYGSIPQGRVVIFRCPIQNAVFRNEDFMYYILPYPE